MNRYFAAVLFVFVLVAPAKAASLTISGSLQPNVPWNGTSASPTFTVGIQNPGNVTNSVIGWQLGLTIVAQGGAGRYFGFRVVHGAVELPVCKRLRRDDAPQSGSTLSFDHR